MSIPQAKRMSIPAPMETKGNTSKDAPATSVFCVGVGVMDVSAPRILSVDESDEIVSIREIVGLRISCVGEIFFIVGVGVGIGVLVGVNVGVGNGVGVGTFVGVGVGVGVTIETTTELASASEAVYVPPLV